MLQNATVAGGMLHNTTIAVVILQNATIAGVMLPEVGTCYFFPGSLIAKSLFCTHGSLLRYFLGFQGSLTAKSLIKKQWFTIVKFAKLLPVLKNSC